MLCQYKHKVVPRFAGRRRMRTTRCARRQCGIPNMKDSQGEAGMLHSIPYEGSPSSEIMKDLQVRSARLAQGFIASQPSHCPASLQVPPFSRTTEVAIPFLFTARGLDWSAVVLGYRQDSETASDNPNVQIRAKPEVHLRLLAMEQPAAHLLSPLLPRPSIRRLGDKPFWEKCQATIPACSVTDKVEQGWMTSSTSAYSRNSPSFSVPWLPPFRIRIRWSLSIDLFHSLTCSLSFSHRNMMKSWASVCAILPP